MTKDKWKDANVMLSLSSVAVMPGQLISVYLHPRVGARPVQVELRISDDGDCQIIVDERGKVCVTSFDEAYPSEPAESEGRDG